MPYQKQICMILSNQKLKPKQMKIFFLPLLLICCIPVFSQQHTATQQAAIDLFTQNKDVEAIAMFKKALQENPKDIFSLNALGVIFNRNNKYAEQYESSAKGMSITGDKGQPFIIQHAESGIELGKNTEALQLLDGLVMQDATLPFMPKAHYLRGRALDGLGKIQEAIGAYSKTIQLANDYSIAYYYRGKDFNSISRSPNALKDFDTYISQDDHAPSYVYSERGVALFNLNRFDEAITDFTKSISLNPSDYMTFYNRGNTYMELGNIASAKADYKSVLAKTNNYAGAYWRMAWVLEKEKSYAEALSMAEKSITMQPKTANYLAVYCLILIDLNREKEAIPVADQILAVDEKNTDGWLYKTIAYSNISDYNSALSTISTGIQKVPDNYLLYGLRANIYRHLNNDAAAAADDAKAKELSSK